MASVITYLGFSNDDANIQTFCHMLMLSIACGCKPRVGDLKKKQFTVTVACRADKE
ncbi:MAG: hypothetical protein WBQ25_02865 [Nitrososphaeraceae archaeon]